MERKLFLTTIAAGGAALAAAGMANAANPPFPTASPSPGASGSPRPHRGEHGSLGDLEHVHRGLEKMIDHLQRDQTDYDGHRIKAISLMTQAKAEVEAAIQWDKDHPNIMSTAAPP